MKSTLISEYANRKDRGKLITLVFSTQALGLIIGPLLTFILLKSGVSSDLTWRLILGFGAIPALATFWRRRQIAETPTLRYCPGRSERGNADRLYGATNNGSVAAEQTDMSSSVFFSAPEEIPANS